MNGVSDADVGWNANNSVESMPGGRGAGDWPHLNCGEGQVWLPVVLQQLLPKCLWASERRSGSVRGGRLYGALPTQLLQCAGQRSAPWSGSLASAPGLPEVTFVP